MQLISIGIILLSSAFPISNNTCVDDEPLVQIPSSLIDLGTGGSSFALVVDKSQSMMDLFKKQEDGSLVRLRSFRASTGINGGAKQSEGDQRTPEGIYYFVRIREDEELLSKYGVRAFDLNYPNQFDLLQGNEGSGIWLHATDEPERLQEPRTSQGCVVVSNDDIRELSRFITLYRTPIVISESMSYAGVKELGALRANILAFMTGWLEAWSSQDFERYQELYSAQFRGSKWRLESWLRNKRAVFDSTVWARIEAADIKILRDVDRYVISFYQRYRSNLMDDTGIKWIYLVDDDGGLKIVGEEWFPLGNALSGKYWSRRAPRLSEIVGDLEEIEFGGGGKPVLTEKQLSVPVSDAGPMSATTEVPEVANEVAVEDFRLVELDRERIKFGMKLSKVDQDGSRSRGWLFVVASWKGMSEVTVFPHVDVSRGVPQTFSEGDSFGIRWFKIVEGSIERPRVDARLKSVRCLAYSQQGTLILDAVLDANED